MYDIDNQKPQASAASDDYGFYGSVSSLKMQGIEALMQINDLAVLKDVVKVLRSAVSNVIAQPQTAATGNSSLMSDTDLEQNLKNLPQYDEETHQEMDTLTISDYRHAIKASRRNPIKGIEKWL